MAKVLIPHVFRDDKNVSPEHLNDNNRRLLRDYQRERNRRFEYFPIVIPFGVLDHTHLTAERSIALALPLGNNCVIVGRELRVAGTSSQVFTVTATDSDWPDISVTGAGAAEALTVDFEGYVPALGNGDTHLELSIDCPDATWSTTSADLILWCVHDRLLGAPPAEPSDFLVLDSDTMAEAATKLNDFETTFNAACTAVSAYIQRASVTVVPFRPDSTGVLNAWEIDFPIPAHGRRLIRAELSVVGDALLGPSTGFSVIASNGGGSTIVTVAATPTGVTNLVRNSGTPSQTMPNDPDDVNDDYVVRFTHGATGTCYRMFAILHWGS